MTKISKIISGGQTGADQGGLEAGKELDLQTGGTAPMGYRTEEGAMPSLGLKYRLGEDSSYLYPPRTQRNVRNSDGTVIFGQLTSPGSKLTIRLCKDLKKPLIANPEKSDFLKWVEENNIKILNVAGNRESKNPGLQRRVREFLVEALR